jgi:mRNA interferase RelE/StbE
VYRIELRRAAYKDLQDLPADYARRIAKHIDTLEQNPRPPDSKKLKGGAGYSLRVGTYRLLYDIDDKEQSITIYRIKHRREVYR